MGRAADSQAPASPPIEWVVRGKAVGRGDKALAYLGCYLYRGIIPEKNILKDQDGSVTFKTVDNVGTEIIQSIPGAEFLWLLLHHVLPKHFRRVRVFGLLHVNAKAVVRLLPPRSGKMTPLSIANPGA